jgi:hypothetical protein
VCLAFPRLCFEESYRMLERMRVQNSNSDSARNLSAHPERRRSYNGHVGHTHSRKVD